LVFLKDASPGAIFLGRRILFIRFNPQFLRPYFARRVQVLTCKFSPYDRFSPDI